MPLFDTEQDESKRTGGVWVFMEELDCRIRIASSGTASFKRKHEEVSKPYQVLRSHGVSDTDDELSALAKLYCDEIALEWQTVAETVRGGVSGLVPDSDGFVPGIDFRGELIADTPENRLKVLGLKTMRHVLLDVIQLAKRLDIFAVGPREEIAKN